MEKYFLCQHWALGGVDTQRPYSYAPFAVSSDLGLIHGAVFTDFKFGGLGVLWTPPIFGVQSVYV